MKTRPDGRRGLLAARVLIPGVVVAVSVVAMLAAGLRHGAARTKWTITAVDRSTSTRHFDTGETLSPESAGTQPIVSPSAAFSTSLDHNPSSFTSASETFGSFTDTQAYSSTDGGATGTPTVTNVPAWLVEFSGECPLEIGGQQPAQTDSPAPCTSTWYVAVNAQTGEFIEAFD
jgi:hypothetical protein